jgi:hypothetical protein
LADISGLTITALLEITRREKGISNGKQRV